MPVDPRAFTEGKSLLSAFDAARKEGALPKLQCAAIDPRWGPAAYLEEGVVAYLSGMEGEEWKGWNRLRREWIEELLVEDL